ncbi:MAG: SGNH/GDSL hydrolase family protein [Planctomycetota bacterium]
MLAVAAGLILSVALAEGVLQIASLFASPLRGLESAADIANRDPNIPVVIFSGDSHTFGLWLKDDETMPARVEQLSKELSAPGIKSINLGRAGATTWIAVDEAIAAIQQIKPSALVLRIGINDGILSRPGKASFMDRFRIVKFARIALSRFGPREPVNYIKKLEVGNRRDEDLNDSTVIAAFDRRTPPADYKKEISELAQRDFKRLATEAALHGVKLFFVSYLDPGFRFRFVNNDLARAAAESGSVYINLTNIGERAISAGRREELLIEDGHPTALGYKIEAREIMRALLASKIINGAEPGDTVDWYIKNRPAPSSGPTHARVELKHVRDDSRTIRLNISTIPNIRVRLIAGRPTGSFTVGDYQIPILYDDAVKFGGNAMTSDALGNAHLQLSAETAANIPEGAVVVAVAELGTGGNVKYCFSDILNLETGEATALGVVRMR